MGSSRKKRQQQKAQGGSLATVRFHTAVLQSIRQHARSSPQMEICGVLMGQKAGSVTTVEGAIAGEGAAQGGAHVTFTQETWVKIHREKDRKYPGRSIVGWYHSHPGFGVFLSDHDVFIHRNFFSEPGHLAWVYDPHSDEEGCFGWDGGQVKRLARFEVFSEITQPGSPRSEPAIQPGPVRQTPLHRLWNVFSLKHLLLLVGLLFSVLFALAVYSLRDSSVPKRISGWFRGTNRGQAEPGFQIPPTRLTW